jgi:hypothetical protein
MTNDQINSVSIFGNSYLLGRREISLEFSGSDLDAPLGYAHYSTP